MTNRPNPPGKFWVARVMFWISSSLTGTALAAAIFGDPVRTPRTAIEITAVFALAATCFVLSSTPRQEFIARRFLYAGVVMNLITLAAMLVIAP